MPSLTFGKGNIDPPQMTYLTWDARNRPTANGLATGESIRIAVTTRSGLVRGSYRDKDSGQRFNFAGVALQKQSLISGWFPGDGATGFFTIEPAGRGDAHLQFTDGNPIVNGGTYGLGNVGYEGGRLRYTYELVNVGTGNLTILDVGFDDPQFYAFSPAVKVLKPGESTLIHFVIRPRASGPQSSVLTIETDVETYAVTIECNGVPGNSNSGFDTRQFQWDGVSPDNRPPGFTPFIDGTYDPANHGGTYQGFIRSFGASESVVGFATVRANPRNLTFSGVLVMNGVRETVRGSFDPTGFFAGATNRGTPFDLFKALVQGGNGGVKLLGYVGGMYELELFRNTFHRTTHPATQYEGPYTILLPSADRRGADVPKGDGYGAATIGLDGRTRAIVMLGDGTRASHSGFVTVDGEWPIYKDLYRTRPKGFVAGRLQFRPLAGISDLDGELQWVKHADRRERRFPRGFEILQIAVGSEYHPPLPGDRAFSVADDKGGQVSAFFSEGDLPGLPAFLDIDWQTDNRIVYQPTGRERLSIRVNPRNGLITGTYRDSARRLRVPFGAAIFYRQMLTSGLFHGEDSTGVFSIDQRLSAWINELHYDNTGADTGEFIEIAGRAGTDLSGYSLVVYDGSTAQAYATINLSGTIDDEGSGHGAVDFPFAGLQNGTRDGIALVDPSGEVLEFLSYEGIMLALDGPAIGLISSDIGVEESDATPVGSSLGRDNFDPASPGPWRVNTNDDPGVLNTIP